MLPRAVGHERNNRALLANLFLPSCRIASARTSGLLRFPLGSSSANLSDDQPLGWVFRSPQQKKTNWPEEATLFARVPSETNSNIKQCLLLRISFSLGDKSDFCSKQFSFSHVSKPFPLQRSSAPPLKAPVPSGAKCWLHVTGLRSDPPLKV